jgi:hypothetical protein
MQGPKNMAILQNRCGCRPASFRGWTASRHNKACPQRHPVVTMTLWLVESILPVNVSQLDGKDDDVRRLLAAVLVRPHGHRCDGMPRA